MSLGESSGSFRSIDRFPFAKLYLAIVAYSKLSLLSLFNLAGAKKLTKACLVRRFVLLS